MTRRRAAYFAQRADYFGRPFCDTILLALHDAGFDVDYFAPNGELPQDLYPHVRRRDVDYRRGWLQRELRPGRWRHYDVFLGNADLPMAFAGTLASMARKPVITACDEVYIGGYEGQAARHWKPVVKWAMRRSVFTIITSLVRIPLQREYAGLPENHEFFEVSSCFATPYDGPRPEHEGFVLSATGAFTPWNGAHWLVPLAGRIRILVQTGGRPDPVTDAFLSRTEGFDYRPERVGWREAAAITAGADASFVCYLSPFPEFQAMGVSSQKLCTSLWLGIPVIATRQPSFAFLEEYGAGILIDSQDELPAAIERVRFLTGAKRAVDEYIQPEEHRRALARRFAAL